MCRASELLRSHCKGISSFRGWITFDELGQCFRRTFIPLDTFGSCQAVTWLVSLSFLIKLPTFLSLRVRCIVRSQEHFWETADDNVMSHLISVDSLPLRTNVFHVTTNQVYLEHLSARSSFLWRTEETFHRCVITLASVSIVNEHFFPKFLLLFSSVTGNKRLWFVTQTPFDATSSHRITTYLMRGNPALDFPSPGRQSRNHRILSELLKLLTG